jgi:hypothetical protein
MRSPIRSVRSQIAQLRVTAVRVIRVTADRA